MGVFLFPLSWRMFRAGTGATWSVCHPATTICPTCKFSRNRAQINKRGTPPWGPSCFTASSMFKGRERPAVGPVGDTTKPAALTGPDWLPGGHWLPAPREKGLRHKESSCASQQAPKATMLPEIHRENSPGLWIQLQSSAQQPLCWWRGDDVLTWSDIYSCYLLLLHFFFCTNCSSTDSILRVDLAYFCYHRYGHWIIVVQLLSNPP